MKILTVYAHPNPKSFCQAVLQQFTDGLKAAGHSNEVVDLYAIGFDPVFREADFASYVNESIPKDVLDRMDLKKYILDSMKGPFRRFLASRWLGANLILPSLKSFTSTDPKTSLPNGRR